MTPDNRHTSIPRDPSLRVALITGGASGIGKSFAEALGEQGLVPLIADVDERAMDDTLSAFASVGIKAIGRQVDLRDKASTDEFAQFAFSLGSVEAVYLNAGVSYSGTSAWDTPINAWNFVVAINLFGLVNQIAATVPLLIKQGTQADLVVTASIAGTVGSPMSAAYGASKAAAVSLAKSLRAELATEAPFIRVAVVNPGMVRTNLQMTSAALQSPEVPVDEGFVAMSHGALNTMGARPEDVVAWTFEALHAGRFWVFPASDDPFLDLLRQELTEMQDVVTRGGEPKG